MGSEGFNKTFWFRDTNHFIKDFNHGGNMNIFVFGSLAYDPIMTFPGRFADNILVDKIDNLNVAFMVDSFVERPGGTAGNIAYSLMLHGQKPKIVSTIGYDYQEYFAWLDQNEMIREHVEVTPTDPTARAYVITDQDENQITIFNPGAMQHVTHFALDMYDSSESIAIISPTNLEDMKIYSQRCKDLDIRYIFDPGQSLPAWEASDLNHAINGAEILIANQYEIDLIKNKTGRGTKDLAVDVGAIIVTMGERGASLVQEQDMSGRAIPVTRSAKVVDPTGAGDAFRGGLLTGLVNGVDLYGSALMGSATASFAVEVMGTQEYRFTMSEFQKRLAQIDKE